MLYGSPYVTALQMQSAYSTALRLAGTPRMLSASDVHLFTLLLVNSGLFQYFLNLVNSGLVNKFYTRYWLHGNLVYVPLMPTPHEEAL